MSDETAPEIEELADRENESASSWLDEPSLEADELEIESYDIVSSPNDWNFTTIVNFIESGAMIIPAYQRNYVWDRTRASKLIESLLLGLPIPQVFLYEADRNKFHVIDGQQRLLTLFFFSRGRFPRPGVRAALRPQLQAGLTSAGFLDNDEYFVDFRLSLPKTAVGRANRLNGLSYQDLGDDRINLDLRTIRNIVVKQTFPDDSSAVFEIFSRLNSGGVNLSAQEIRASLFHSELFDAVLEFNYDSRWRAMVGRELPDPRMRDTEFLFRALALGQGLDKLSGSLVGFVNAFCKRAQGFDTAQVQAAVADLGQFVGLFGERGHDTLARAGKFSGVLFEATFAAWIQAGKPSRDSDALRTAINSVKNSRAFATTIHEGSTKATNVRARVGLVAEAMKA